jgi:acetyltransferase-like isoleucine patch superfamily enzyme
MAATISRLTVVDATVNMGEDCRIWAFASIGAGVQMGDRCVIGSAVYIGHSSILGHDVHLNHGVFLPNCSRLGNRVFVGPNVTCTDDKYPRVNNPNYQAEPPIIEDDVNIGAGAVILPGVHLGKGCTIGAGAVVTRNVPAGETWIGIPAKRQQRFPNLPEDGGWLYRMAKDCQD